MAFIRSRRGFLRTFGIGVSGVGALAVACGGPSANQAAALYQQSRQTRGGATAAVAASLQQTGAAGTRSGSDAGTAVDQIDQKHEDGVKAFLAGATGMAANRLPFTVDGGVKVFNITVKTVKWEIMPGDVREVLSYNGVLPGPEIRVNEDDRVRIVVKNELTESTSVHWHGLRTPNGMDGVPFVTQPVIKPGATFTYEFTAAPSGSHMYHSHHNAMEQVGKGLLGAFIVEPKDRAKYGRYDSDYTMVLNDSLLGFTLNGKGFPATQPIIAKYGERVLVRFMNEGLMNHPMHLHGMPMQVVAKDGYPLPNPYLCDVVDVAPGDRYDVIIECDNPGAWAFHCHTLSHAESPRGMFGLVTALVVGEPA